MKFDKSATQQKSFSLKAASGVEVTPEILAKINKYSLRELKADEIFVRKYLMAHNAIDRDNERFSEALLDDFASTLSGKSLLNGHDRYTLPLGLFFDAITEEMTPDQFRTITGEEARLPDNVQTVKALYGWIYMLKSDFNTPMTENIDAGIYRHASIGFKASDIKPVKGQYDNILYWEYVSPGEALEGSIVWLGAQPGATAQKKHGDIPGSHKQPQINVIDGLSDNPTLKKGGAGGFDNNKGGHKMEKFLKVLQKVFPGKVFTTEDNLADEMKAALDSHTQAVAADEVAKAVKPLNDRISELAPLAADGKVYRDDLVGKYVANKAKLGEVDETPEAQDKVKAVAGAYPIDFLKSEVDVLQKRVDEKFPAGPQTRGDDRTDKSKDISGEKDWRKNNPLTPKKEG